MLSKLAKTTNTVHIEQETCEYDRKRWVLGVGGVRVGV
jgi:hypothetical protein